MSENKIENGGRLREDIVVSVCFFDLEYNKYALEQIRKLASQLDETYRFREFILVVADQDRELYNSFVEEIDELRLFVVKEGIGYYARRIVAAEEAIGDVVVIASINELLHVDVRKFIQSSEEFDALTIATRTRARPIRMGLYSPIIALGRVAGFNLNLDDFQTIAIPRTLLNQLLRHPEPELALRFPPRDRGLPLASLRIEALPTSNLRRLNELPRRLQLLQKLLVYLAPSLLVLVALTSSILTVLGIGYAMYVLGAWIVLDALAPGWLTTSIMLSLSATFMGLSVLGLSLGLQQLLNQKSRTEVRPVSEEVNRIDLFGKVASDLNVEVETDLGRGER